MKEIEFSKWLFVQNSTANSTHLAAYFCPALVFSLPSKSHREDSISPTLLEFPHQVQVDMKNVVKCWKDFLSYFTTLETYRGLRVIIAHNAFP